MQRNETQTALAARAGVSTPTLAALEKGPSRVAVSLEGAALCSLAALTPTTEGTALVVDVESGKSGGNRPEILAGRGEQYQADA